jgi:molybdopterin-guanine dinucleotide biosynthesis protein A
LHDILFAAMENIFEGFVLAGGKSRRMGADKAFLQFGDKTFLENAVNALAPVCEGKVSIVLNLPGKREKFSRLLPSTPCVTDIYTERGALGGIHAALKNSIRQWAIILACDLPFVSAETIKLLTGFALEEYQTAAIVPKQIDGTMQPLCAIYKAEICLPVLEKLFRENQSVSVKELINSVSSLLVEQKEIAEALVNVNDLSEYQKALHKISNLELRQ